MSRSTHPSATINHDRGLLRKHTRRVRANRCREALQVQAGTISREDLIPGTMEHHQSALGCNRAGCGLCKPERGRRGRSNARRPAAKRMWMRDAIAQIEGFGR